MTPQPRRRGAFRALVGWLVFALVCATFWIVAGPAQLGGPASYIIVDGPSMEPTYHEGDLVVTRAQERYEVGDVVAYLPDIGQDFPVIHRIVEKAGEGQYVTQGDNRAQPDGWFATDANIFGAAWVLVPNGGTVVVLLRQPATWLAVALGFFGMALIVGATHGKNRARRLAPARSVKRFLPVPPIMIVVLLAASASAADLALDGGVLQEFQLGPGLGLPLANAGEDQTVIVGSEAILDGSGSTDPDGSSLNYSWALAAPDGSTAALDDATSATPKFVADVAGTYVVELTVQAGELGSLPDTVSITAIETDSITPIPVPDTTSPTVRDTTTTVPDITTTVPDITTTVPDTTTTVPDATSTVPDATTTVPDTTTTVPDATTTVPDTTTTVPDTTTTVPDTSTTVADTTTTIPNTTTAPGPQNP